MYDFSVANCIASYRIIFEILEVEKVAVADMIMKVIQGYHSSAMVLLDGRI